MINYDDFITIANVIERTPLPKLHYFLDSEFEILHLDDGGSEFVSYGLMELIVPTPEIKLRDKYIDYGEKYSPSKFEIIFDKVEIINFFTKAHVNDIGRIFRKFGRS